MKILDSGLESVPGYTFSSIKCGIRYNDRLDYSLIMADGPCHASGLFTRNKIVAAPVKICRERINNTIRAVLINATNANACTGDEGYNTALTLTSNVAEKTGIEPGSVLMASTGVIGRQLPLDKMLASHDELISSLDRDNGRVLPEAIMTTDTFPKKAAARFSTDKGDFTVGGTAKGSGMIAPDMATLLAFILTDAPLDKKDLDRIFKKAVDKTLNAITIDGDMSTNDTALILSPITGDPLKKSADLEEFEKALVSVLQSLAGMLISDGEGATKSVTIHVINAGNDSDAKKIARAVSESLLVKTAFFGNDPNWGRIAAAAGYSGAQVEEKNLSIFYDRVPLLLKGVPQESALTSIQSVLEKKDLVVTIDVGLGKSEAVMLTTDISYDYVKINAQYST